MNLANMLSGFQAFGLIGNVDYAPVAPSVRVSAQKPARAARFGDVTVSLGVANDIAVPANDAGRDTHFRFKRALEKRVARLEAGAL